MPGFLNANFKSRLRGPISSGRMERDVVSYERDVAEALGEEGRDMMLSRLASVLRHPTGYYESRIDVRPLSATRYEVHDSGVVYGNWLEGTGSRNSPVTVFPGYHSFKIVEEQLQAKRSTVARRILRRYRASGRLI